MYVFSKSGADGDIHNPAAIVAQTKSSWVQYVTKAHTDPRSHHFLEVEYSDTLLLYRAFACNSVDEHHFCTYDELLLHPVST